MFVSNLVTAAYVKVQIEVRPAESIGFYFKLKYINVCNYRVQWNPDIIKYAALPIQVLRIKKNFG